MTAFSEENLDDFSFTQRRDIVYHLRQLVEDGHQVSISFNEGRETILSILLDVNEENGLLIFDWGSSEAVNKRFLASDKNFFVAMPDGIRHQFICAKPSQISYKKRPAFSVALPKKYIRLQRRDFFRLLLPMTMRPTFRVALTASSELDGSVIDIGLGGLSIEVAEANVRCEVGDRLQVARIYFKSADVLRADIEVRYKAKMRRGTKQVTRLGCRFSHLDPAQELLLQKYITNVQRDERARLGE